MKDTNSDSEMLKTLTNKLKALMVNPEPASSVWRDKYSEVSNELTKFWKTMEDTMKKAVDSKHFCQMLSLNVDNTKLTDAEFRKFVKRTLPIVDFPRTEKQENPWLEH